MTEYTPNNATQRIVSAMRVTGRMHLGNYHGALKNWLELQNNYECFFFAADWHGLTTNYEESAGIAGQSLLMVQDWLAAGLDPDLATLFIQSGVPEHAELHLLLSMITPLSWLERVPTYKDQQDKLKDKDLATYGFLGYPLLQSADILIYKAGLVPVGEDQVVHVELTREIARRFNYIYGRGKDFIQRAEDALQKMGKKHASTFRKLLKRYQEEGDREALAEGHSLLRMQSNLSSADGDSLAGYLEGHGRLILHEPEAMLTKESKFPGLDGQKMSKSYDNTIALTEEPESVTQKIKRMQTDPARVKRTDPGDPEKCPVWEWHKIYSDTEVQSWASNGCKTAGIGCLDCKKPLIEAVINEQKPIIERAQYFAENPQVVEKILREGAEQARAVAQETLKEVRIAMGIA